MTTSPSTMNCSEVNPRLAIPGCNSTFPLGPALCTAAHGGGIPKRDTQGDSEGDRIQTFRHAYNSLIARVGTDDPNKLKGAQMQLLRHGDERTNDRGKSAPPLRQRARQGHINVNDLGDGRAG